MKQSLSEGVVQALKKLQITQLNEMQNCMQEEMQMHDSLILLSPTGSGKTLAFLLPLLNKLTVAPPTPQAMIIVPSRELALQIHQVWESMKTGMVSVACYGGHAIADEKKAINNLNASLIIGTPGRLLDHIDKSNFNVKALQTLIIDEFDKCLEFGFQDQMNDIVDQLDQLRQRVLSSATDGPELPLFAGMSRARVLNYLPISSSSDRISIYKVSSPTKDKIDTLFSLLCTFGSDSSIVFLNHRSAVERVVEHLRTKGISAAGYHGGMEQIDREKQLFTFRTGSKHVLVATDLAARGLDISEVKNIVHYHLTNTQDAYTHRNGRTARWDANGNAYIILSGEEELPEFIEDEVVEYQFPEYIPNPPKSKWATLYIGRGKQSKLSKMDIVGFLCKQCDLTPNEIGLIVIKPKCSYVAIKRSKLKETLKASFGLKIKKVKTIIEEAK